MNRKEIAILAVIIFLTVVAWIVFDIYHARTFSTISSKELRQVVPLTPAFDGDILRKLSTREE